MSLYKLICTVFNVNEDWLLNGAEPMFIEPDTFSLDAFIKERGGDDLEMQIIKAYFELDEETRRSVVEHFKEKLAAWEPAPMETAEAAYEKSLGVAPSSESTVSSTTDATDEVG